MFKSLLVTLNCCERARMMFDVDLAERNAAASAMQATFNPDLGDNDEVLDEGSVQDNGSIDDDTLRISGMRNLDVDKLLEVQDSSNVKGPGLLMYTLFMP